MPSLFAYNYTISCLIKITLNNFPFAPNSCSFVFKKQSIPWPPSKAQEWTFVECVTPFAKHGNSWELKCNFCAKEFKATSITRIRKHFLGTSNNIELCWVIPQ